MVACQCENRGSAFIKPRCNAAVSSDGQRAPPPIDFYIGVLKTATRADIFCKAVSGESGKTASQPGSGQLRAVDIGDRALNDGPCEAGSVRVVNLAAPGQATLNLDPIIHDPAGRCAD